MRLRTGVAATTLAALGLFFSNAETVAQTTTPPQPLKQPTPHYLLGVPLPKFEVGGRLLKPTFRVYFPEDPGGFYKNQKDILKRSITTDDGRTHPVLKRDDIEHPGYEIDTTRRNQDHIQIPQHPVYTPPVG